MYHINNCEIALTCLSFIDTLHLEQLLSRCVQHIVKCLACYRTSGEQRPIHDTGEHHTKRTRLSKMNAINECVEENTNSLYCKAEVKAKMKVKIYSNGLNLQILIAIRTVISNHSSE